MGAERVRTPDVNVLVYATNLDAPQRAAAARWLEEAFRDPAGIAFTWHALAAFLRLSTQGRIVPKALPLETALQVMDEWLGHPRARIIGATERHAAVLGRLLIGAGRGGNLVGDAQLAAIAISHGAVLGTFDRDFERFAGLRFEHLDSQSIPDLGSHYRA
ncbi:MAG: PIN domain-containing protein [Rhodanobacteraceae bacterium]|nr:MAG: PIN domain-containing protein [Rhodanobacteraceae bacterium]